MTTIIRIQWRSGTAAQWTTANPTLYAGEPGYETDTLKYKIGDGVTAWNSLPYQAESATVTNATVNAAIATDAAASRTSLALGTAALADVLDFATPADVGLKLDKAGGTMTGPLIHEIPDSAGGIWAQVLGSSLSPTTRNFNFGVRSFPGVNEPGSSRQNTVVSIGWNTNAAGAREDVTDAAFRIGFEDHYLQGGVGTPAFEYHVECRDESGVSHRMYSVYAPKDGGAGSSTSFMSDRYNFNTYSGAQGPRIDTAAKVIETFDYNIRGNNNVGFLRQKNAAGSANLYLPYFNDKDVYTMVGPVAVGTTPSPVGSTYAGDAYAINASALATGNTILRLFGSVVTGSYFAIQAQGSATNDFKHAIYNNSNAASSHAVIELRTIGASAGDPLIRYNVNGGAQWQVGLDNSDSDKFKWGTAALGSADKMELDTSGNLKILAGFACNGATPAAKPTIIGSRTDGTALANLLTALASTGLITDSTTA